MKFSTTLALTALLGSTDARKCEQYHPWLYGTHSNRLEDDKRELYNYKGGYGNSASNMKFDKEGNWCISVKAHVTNIESEMGFWNGHTNTNWHMNPANIDHDVKDGLFDFSFFYNVKSKEYDVYLNETDLWYHGKKDMGDSHAQFYTHLFSKGEYVEMVAPPHYSMEEVQHLSDKEYAESY